MPSDEKPASRAGHDLRDPESIRAGQAVVVGDLPAVEPVPSRER